jgi:peptide/nickel transport system substrate-binding protein
MRAALAVLACGVVLGIVAAAPGGATETAKPRVGGTVVIAGSDPGCFSFFRPDCGTNAPGLTFPAAVDQVLEGAFEVAPDFTYHPNLVSHVKLTKNPFTVTYFIRREAKWSDGMPVTARDFAFTFKAFTRTSGGDPLLQELYREIRSVQAVDAKTVKVGFRAPVSDWRDFFHEVLPEHALAGQDLQSVWADAVDNPTTGTPIASGPFFVQKYERGRQLTLVRNARYWGKHKAYLDRMVFRFFAVGDFNAQVDALRSGSVDMIAPPIQPELAQLRHEPGITVRSTAAIAWEQIAVRLVPKGNPVLQKAFVRRALAYGIDRKALVGKLFLAINPSLRPLESGVFLTNSPFYHPNWRFYRHGPARARRLLEGNGCRRGSDGIYICAGERLSFRLATTAGNRFRQLTVQIVQTQLRRVGIEVVPVFASPSVFFGQITGGGDFDLALFAYFATPDAAARLATDIWSCGGRDNTTGYCKRQLSHELLASERIVAPAAQAAQLNRLDRQIARDVPNIPLYQRPTFLAFKNTIHNVVDNPTAEFFTWNSEDWWIGR